MKNQLFIALILIASVATLTRCDKEYSEDYGTITGVVTDFATGEPVKNANVKLRPSGETTLTGSDGSYSFKDLKPGEYSLFLSKADYSDQDDDYVIILEAGKNIRRDIQMKQTVAFLRIMDENGNKMSVLDFGADTSIISRYFKVFNDGTSVLNCNLSNYSNWITSITPDSIIFVPGQTVSIIVTINRNFLSGGNNSTFLHIKSANSSIELEVRAIGLCKPTLSTNNITDITATSATCGGNISSDGGAYVTERGICWATANAPTIENDHIAMGEDVGNFICNMTSLTPNTVYYVRAYATNSRGIAYGLQKSFTTTDGSPIVATTNPTLNGTTVVTGGNVISDGGCGDDVTARGICYGTLPYPNLNNSSYTLDGTGMGYYTSQFSATDISTTTYYIRAYATNARGTAYGEQKTVGPYDALPSFTYNGHTYKVAPCPSTSEDDFMTWSTAYNYCENLTAYGFSDWRLPTLRELEMMYQLRTSIGGWHEPYTSSSDTPCYQVYWTSSYYSTTTLHYYVILWYNGTSYSNDFLQQNGYECGNPDFCIVAKVRPIRIEN